MTLDIPDSTCPSDAKKPNDCGETGNKVDTSKLKLYFYNGSATVDEHHYRVVDFTPSQLEEQGVKPLVSKNLKSHEPPALLVV